MGLLRRRRLQIDRADLPDDPGKRARAQSGVPIVPALDGLRVTAVFMVIAYHVWGGSQYRAFHGSPIATLIGYALPSFDLMFILSGFVMFLPTAARDGDFGSVRVYAIRRLARIIPGFYACVILVLLFYPYLVGVPTFSWFGGLAVLGHLTFLHTEALVFPGLIHRVPIGFGADGPMWTLSVEACFYLTLPFVARALYRRPIALTAAAIAFSALFRIESGPITSGWLQLLGHTPSSSAVASTANGFMLQFPAYVGDFAIGMLCALVVVRLQRRPLGPWQPAAALLAALGSLAFLALYVPHHTGAAPVTTLFHRDALAETLVPLALLPLVVGVSLAPRRAQWPLANPIVRRLADRSYGIYLYHMPLLLFGLTTLGLPLGTKPSIYFLWLGFGLVTSVAAGWLSYALIEAPIRRRAQRFTKRIQSAPAPRLALASDPAS